MGGIISLTLVSSQEPGYCINRQYTDPEAALENLRDLGFPNQGGWTAAQDGQSIISQSQITQGTVTVVSLDYGGWGSVTAQIEPGTSPIGYAMARDKRRPATGPDRRLSCNVPWDEDGDHIADGQDRSLNQNGYSGPDNVRDPEALRSTAISNFRGDGFSDYEEYRGVVLGGNWRMLERDQPEVFVQDRDGLGLAGFGGTGLTIRMVTNDDHNGGVVNWTSSAQTRIIQQRRLLLINAGAHPNAQLFGEATGGPNIPANIGECRVYVTNIERWVNSLMLDAGTSAALRQFEINHMISHELAHGVNVPHHPNDGPWECYMRYVTNTSWQLPNAHSTYCTAAGFNEVNRFLRLRP